MALTNTQWVFVAVILVIIVALLVWAYQQGKFSAAGAGNGWLVGLVIVIVVVLVGWYLWVHNGQVNANIPASLNR